MSEAGNRSAEAENRVRTIGLPFADRIRTPPRASIRANAKKPDVSGFFERVERREPPFLHESGIRVRRSAQNVAMDGQNHYRWWFLTGLTYHCLGYTRQVSLPAMRVLIEPRRSIRRVRSSRPSRADSVVGCFEQGFFARSE